MASKEYCKKWEEDHREQRSARRRERQADDPAFRERNRLAHARYRKNHPEKSKEEWAKAKLRPGYSEERRLYYQDHKKEIDMKAAAFKVANPEIVKARSIRLHANYLSRGLCYNCPSPRMPNSDRVCEKHWFMQMSRGLYRSRDGKIIKTRLSILGSLWKILKKKLEEQNYTCPYTGRQLTPGVNASLDHILPKSRYPDLTGDLNNVEWVDLSINFIKRDLTKEEFLATCREILDYTKDK